MHKSGDTVSYRASDDGHKGAMVDVTLPTYSYYGNPVLKGNVRTVVVI